LGFTPFLNPTAMGDAVFYGHIERTLISADLSS
jgi:hypothetical protein